MGCSDYGSTDGDGEIEEDKIADELLVEACFSLRVNVFEAPTCHALTSRSVSVADY